MCAWSHLLRCELRLENKWHSSTHKRMTCFYVLCECIQWCACYLCGTTSPIRHCKILTTIDITADAAAWWGFVDLPELEGLGLATPVLKHRCNLEDYSNLYMIQIAVKLVTAQWLVFSHSNDCNGRQWYLWHDVTPFRHQKCWSMSTGSLGSVMMSAIFTKYWSCRMDHFRSESDSAENYVRGVNVAINSCFHVSQPGWLCLWASRIFSHLLLEVRKLIQFQNTSPIL